MYWIHATFSPPIWNPQYPLPERAPLSEHTWDQAAQRFTTYWTVSPLYPLCFFWEPERALLGRTQLEKTWSQEQDSLQEVQFIRLFPSWQLSLFPILCNGGPYIAVLELPCLAFSMRLPEYPFALGAHPWWPLDACCYHLRVALPWDCDRSGSISWCEQIWASFL